MLMSNLTHRSLASKAQLNMLRENGLYKFITINIIPFFHTLQFNSRFYLCQTNSSSNNVQTTCTQAQCEGSQHGRQKCKDLFGNHGKRLKKIIIWKNSQLKCLTLLPLWVSSFLFAYFPDPTWSEPFFNFSVSHHVINLKGFTLRSREPTKLSQIFWDKMIHGHNFTSESIDKDWTSTHHQHNSSLASNLRR